MMPSLGSPAAVASAGTSCSLPCARVLPAGPAPPRGCLSMKRLDDAVELLDGPLDDPVALAGNLRDLRRINRWLGGAALSSAAIQALAAHRAEMTLLDVGTGGADIPLALLTWARRNGRRMTVVAID